MALSVVLVQGHSHVWAAQAAVAEEHQFASYEFAPEPESTGAVDIRSRDAPHAS